MHDHHELIWRGNDLCAGNRRLVSIEQDKTYPAIWRVRLGERLTDMVNVTRARDAARAAALAILNRSPDRGIRPLAAPPMRLNRKPVKRRSILLAPEFGPR
jgi:hypothetical protein